MWRVSLGGDGGGGAAVIGLLACSTGVCVDQQECVLEVCMSVCVCAPMAIMAIAAVVAVAIAAAAVAAVDASTVFSFMWLHS